MTNAGRLSTMHCCSSLAASQPRRPACDAHGPAPPCACSPSGKGLGAVWWQEQLPCRRRVRRLRVGHLRRGLRLPAPERVVSTSSGQPDRLRTALEPTACHPSTVALRLCSILVAEAACAQCFAGTGNACLERRPPSVVPLQSTRLMPPQSPPPQSTQPQSTQPQSTQPQSTQLVSMRLPVGTSTCTATCDPAATCKLLRSRTDLGCCHHAAQPPEGNLLSQAGAFLPSAGLTSGAWQQCGGRSACPAGVTCGDNAWAACTVGSGCKRLHEW